jgi:hypothetical protein
MSSSARAARRAAAAVLAAGLLAALPRTAGADDRLPRWTTDVTLAGGFAASTNVFGSAEGKTGYQLFPHVGVFVTEEWGPGWAPDWLRGTLEVMAEPVWVHVDARQSDNHAGLTLGARWVFAAEGRWRAYAEAGGGLLAGESAIPQTNCDVLFVFQGGVGALYFLGDRHAISVGYRLHHMSNGGLCPGNLSLNNSVFTLGISTFLP